jgi:hypothetical protein
VPSSFASRIWSRVKQVLPRSKSVSVSETTYSEAETSHIANLAQDLEFAISVDANVRGTRELFDVNAILPECKRQREPELGSTSTSAADSSVIPIADWTSPDEDAIFFATISALQATSAKTYQPELDLSFFAPFASNPGAPATSQLEKHLAQASGRLSLRNRASRITHNLAARFDLSDTDLHTLTKLVKRHRLNYRVISEFEILLAKGYSVDELMTASNIRKLWRTHEFLRCEIPRYCRSAITNGLITSSSYFASFEHPSDFSRRTAEVKFSSSGQIPTWKMAARWATTLGVLPISELESILDLRYQAWLENSKFWRDQPSFTIHFDRSLRELATDITETIPWDYCFPDHRTDEGDSNPSEERIRARRLYELGLIPDIWADPFDDRVSIDPEFPLLKDYWPKGDKGDDDE